VQVFRGEKGFLFYALFRRNMSSIQLKGKGKDYPRTGHEGTEEE
jgi:hypothetical protein